MRHSENYVSAKITLNKFFVELFFVNWVRLRKLNPCENLLLYGILQSEYFYTLMEIQWQTNSDAITIGGHKPKLDNSINKDRIT